MRSRERYEFSMPVKIEALRRADWKCECCGIPKQETFEQYLEIHHKIAIGYYLDHLDQFSFVAPEIINSLVNCEVLCHHCHKEVHRKDSVSRYLAIAHAIIDTDVFTLPMFAEIAG